MHGREEVRQNQQSAALLARKTSHHCLDLASVGARRGPRRQREGRGSVLDGAHHQTGKRRGCRIVQDRRALDRRRDLRQHPQPFARHRRVKIGEAGDVAAGVRETLDKTSADRVGKTVNTIGIVLVCRLAAATDYFESGRPSTFA